MLTRLLVRPAARGGKYLGPDAADACSISAYVALHDPNTGALVTDGFVDTAGQDAGPADLMAPISRAAPYATDGTTIGIVLNVDIDVPTVFRVSAYGPLSHSDQTRLAQADVTVLPGVDIGVDVNPVDHLVGYAEGLVVEVPGLCLSNVQADWSTDTVTAFATVTMMCGCKIVDQANWPWPPANFHVELRTRTASGKLYIYALQYDPAAVSAFNGRWPRQSADADAVVGAWLVALQPALGNQGTYQLLPALPAGYSPYPVVAERYRALAPCDNDLQNV